MRRQIMIQDEHHEVTVLDRFGEQWMNVGDAAAQLVAMTENMPGFATVKADGREEQVEIVLEGETAYVKAFGRYFTLQIVDPVEQAVQSSGSQSNSALAPMPGVVIDIQVGEGDIVTKGQPLMTIESMKILTIIKAPRDGSVEQVHLKADQTFEKNTLLVSLTKVEGS
jgi:acetyl/propionyl-CoA carboxylase alpha subunit